MKTLGQFLKINEDIFDVDIEKIKYKKGDRLNKTLTIKSFWRNRCVLESDSNKIYIDHNTSLKLLDLMVAGITTIEIVGPGEHLNIICDEDLDFKGLTIHYNGHTHLGNINPTNKKETIKNLVLKTPRLFAWSSEEDKDYFSNNSNNGQISTLDNVCIKTKILSLNCHKFKYSFNKCKITTNIIWIWCSEDDNIWIDTENYDFSEFRNIKFKEIVLISKDAQKEALKSSFNGNNILKWELFKFH